MLEWDGASLRTHPYRRRMLKLLVEMKQALLLKEVIWTPTTRQALANSLFPPDLAILATVSALEEQYHLLGDLLEAGGEGVIVRKLAAASDESPWKYKFQADLDAFAFAVEPGAAGGSLKLGLLRCGQYCQTLSRIWSRTVGPHSARIDWPDASRPQI